MGLVNRLSRIVAFLRAGYPTGMPATGYVPLAALLPRRLCDDEITTVTGEFMSRPGAGPIATADVGVAIFRITNEMPSLADVERVRRRLDAIGCTRLA
jgi:hypothetical protein